jgi:ABC-type glycerol-3-phosphate transport system permease component
MKKGMVLYSILIVLSVILLLPLYYLLITSFKTFNEVIGPLTWLPENFMLNNFRELFMMDEFYIVRFFSNTMLIFVLKSIGTVASCSLAAYGFVKYNFKYKNVIFAIMLTVIMLPGELLTIPMYEIYMNIGWFDTYKPFYVATFFATDIFMLFLFRQFFMSVPRELFQAAQIDGASEFSIYHRIMLPLSKPVIVTCLLLYFTGTYNDIYTPMLYLASTENYTMAQGIRNIESLFNSGSRDYIVPWNIVSAATLLSLLPVLVLFFFAQKQFVEGVATTGIKG